MVVSLQEKALWDVSSLDTNHTVGCIIPNLQHHAYNHCCNTHHLMARRVPWFSYSRRFYPHTSRDCGHHDLGAHHSGKKPSLKKYYTGV